MGNVLQIWSIRAYVDATDVFWYKAYYDLFIIITKVVLAA